MVCLCVCVVGVCVCACVFALLLSRVCRVCFFVVWCLGVCVVVYPRHPPCGGGNEEKGGWTPLVGAVPTPGSGLD